MINPPTPHAVNLIYRRRGASTLIYLIPQPIAEELFEAGLVLLDAVKPHTYVWRGREQKKLIDDQRSVPSFLQGPMTVQEQAEMVLPIVLHFLKSAKSITLNQNWPVATTNGKLVRCHERTMTLEVVSHGATPEHPLPKEGE